jgi:hypothetical protein
MSVVSVSGTAQVNRTCCARRARLPGHRPACRLDDRVRTSAGGPAAAWQRSSREAPEDRGARRRSTRRRVGAKPPLRNAPRVRSRDPSPVPTRPAPAAARGNPSGIRWTGKSWRELVREVVHRRTVKPPTGAAERAGAWDVQPADLLGSLQPVPERVVVHVHPESRGAPARRHSRRPVEVCDNCGDTCLDVAPATRLDTLTGSVLAGPSDVAFVRYKAS